MASQRLSVGELKEYWKSVRTFAEGQQIGAVHLLEMPPWTDLCSELDWKFHRTGRGAFAKKHHGRSGVYRLIGLAFEGDLTIPATLNRACGQDATGTLYIGMSKSLNDRLNQLRRSLRLRTVGNPHDAISMLNVLPLATLFPPNKLAIAALFTGRYPRMVERDLIKAYLNSFGDTPPLNYQL